MKKRYLPAIALAVLFGILMVAAAFSFSSAVNEGEVRAPSSSEEIVDSLYDESVEADILQTSTVYWYPAPNNNASSCWYRGQEGRWRWVLRSPGWVLVGECKKVIYPGRNLTIPSV